MEQAKETGDGADDHPTGQQLAGAVYAENAQCEFGRVEPAKEPDGKREHAIPHGGYDDCGGTDAGTLRPVPPQVNNAAKMAPMAKPRLDHIRRAVAG
jgi:hypothetical protein